MTHHNGQNNFETHFETTLHDESPSNGINSRKKINNPIVLYEHLFNELENSLNTTLDLSLKEALKNILSDYENSLQNRVLEEKDQIINQLKQSLVDLTEKRFRHSLSSSSKEASPALEQSSSHLNNSNIEFLLNEKDSRIRSLLDELNESQLEIDKLKKIIKDQDNVILSHNNNLNVIYFNLGLFSTRRSFKV